MSSPSCGIQFICIRSLCDNVMHQLKFEINNISVWVGGNHVLGKYCVHAKAKLNSMSFWTRRIGCSVWFCFWWLMITKDLRNYCHLNSWGSLRWNAIESYFYVGYMLFSVGTWLPLGFSLVFVSNVDFVVSWHMHRIEFARIFTHTHTDEVDVTKY